MKKNNTGNLPKVISKINRDISATIDTNIASEAELLKDLVGQVRDTNMEVKKNRNLRFTESKRKLAELDDKINELNSSIDFTDRETVIMQLNEMIDAENNIFKARQEIRFFEIVQTPKRISNLEDIHQELVSSIDKTVKFENIYRNELISSNGLLFDEQISVTREIIALMGDLFDSKRDSVENGIIELQALMMKVKDYEDNFNNFISSNLQDAQKINANDFSEFSDIDDEVSTNEKILSDYEKAIMVINEGIESIKAKFEPKKQEINQNYIDYENEVIESQELKHLKLLEEEKIKRIAIENKLQNIKLQMINAEKKNDIDLISKLMKTHDKISRSATALTVTNKLTKETSQITKKAHEKAMNQLLNIEIKYVTDLNKQLYLLDLEKIKFEEAKILYKIQSDLNGLQKDQTNSIEKAHNLREFIEKNILVSSEIANLKKDIRLNELNLLEENELRDLELINDFKKLLLGLEKIETNRMKSMKKDISNFHKIGIELEYQLRINIENIKLDQEINEIDKYILTRKNEVSIKNEKIKEEANSEIIFQESLVNIAKKEHALQLIKVESLYENEKNLSEEQIERINLGAKVNEAFVKTTLENQLLFANQQIKCAESEYEIRIESINLTLSQELDYSNKKIDSFRKKFDYEKSKVQKELEDSLEDLNYKLLLFTDEKDEKKIIAKIQSIKNSYNKMIEGIETAEKNDVEIKRYEKVISDAKNRAYQAIEEAEVLKVQTIESFENLYNQTKEKFNLIQEKNLSIATEEKIKDVLPSLNNTAISSANDRLQRAIIEANALYQEKIISPLKIIAETRELLNDMTNSIETDTFVYEKSNQKNQLIKEHKDKINELLLMKEQSIAQIFDEIFESKLNDKMIKQEENSYTTVNYHDKSEILFDYSSRKDQAVDLQLKTMNKLSEYKESHFISLDKVTDESNIQFKNTIKSYKTYIKQASKGLNAQKEISAKDYEKKLKKAISEIESRFKRNAN